MSSKKRKLKTSTSTDLRDAPALVTVVPCDGGKRVQGSKQGAYAVVGADLSQSPADAMTAVRAKHVADVDKAIKNATDEMTAIKGKFDSGPFSEGFEKAKQYIDSYENHKAQLTEAIGEKGAEAHMKANYPDYQMIFGFKEQGGTGFDDVYVKLDTKGNVEEVMIVEAKGPGAELETGAKKGDQMSKEWVENTASTWINSPDPRRRQAGWMIYDSLDEGPLPHVKGKVVRANKNSTPPPDYLTQELDCPDSKGSDPKAGVYN